MHYPGPGSFLWKDSVQGWDCLLQQCWLACLRVFEIYPAPNRMKSLIPSIGPADGFPWFMMYLCYPLYAMKAAGCKSPFLFGTMASISGSPSNPTQRLFRLLQQP